MTQLPRSVQLMVKWHMEHPSGFVPVEHVTPPPDDQPPEVLALEHSKWRALKCYCCNRRGVVSGLWQMQFNGKSPQLEWMCAGCGLTEAWKTWCGGYMRRSLLFLTLKFTVTYR